MASILQKYPSIVIGVTLMDTAQMLAIQFMKDELIKERVVEWTVYMAKKIKRAWWLDEDPYSDRFYKYRNKETSNFKVKFCDWCQRAHEEIYQDKSGMITNYYLDFPSYGLKRVPCKECVDERS
tara:strand:+ start:337 stop:708 length:372 start_codon:yes stop_codon:yes gene_type:complete